MGLVLESESSSSSLLVAAVSDTGDMVTQHWVLLAQGDAIRQQDWLPPPPARPIPFFLLFFSFFTWNTDIGSFLVLLADLALLSGSLLSSAGTGELMTSQSRGWAVMGTRGDKEQQKGLSWEEIAWGGAMQPPEPPGTVTGTRCKALPSSQQGQMPVTTELGSSHPCPLGTHPSPSASSPPRLREALWEVSS